MNSELEAIMRRRRRKADGLPPSSPLRTHTAAPAGEVAVPPPPSSLSMRRNKMPLRRRNPPQPDQDPRRTLDQIRGMETPQQEPIPLGSIEGSATGEPMINDSMVTNTGAPNDSMLLKADDIPTPDVMTSLEESNIDSPSAEDSIIDNSTECESSVESPSAPMAEASVEQDSSVESLIEDESSSEELVQAETTQEGPLFEESLPEASFTNFDAFPAFGENVSQFDAAYEPPPAFAAFEPVEQVDYSPLSDPPTRAVPPEVSFHEDCIISTREDSYHCPPVINPSSGNIILCRTNSTTNDVMIHEVDPRTRGEVFSTPVLTDDIKQKFKSIYGTTVHGVSKVLSITAGVHKPQGQQARVRVAALVDFRTFNQAGKHLTRSAVVVFQWGYGSTTPISLQSLLSPPNKTSFVYDPDSLRMADGLIFLSGSAKTKGPCVFCVKPNLKDVWSANILPGAGKISSLAVTTHPHRKFKYVAIAQTDGKLSVWTYERAVNRKGAETPKTLFPLCRLDGTSAITKVEEPIKIGNEDGESFQSDTGHCTHLEWSTPSSTTVLLLAAAFTNGMALFHVSLPLLMEEPGPLDAPDAPGVTKSIPDPTASTQLSQTVSLAPFVAARWSHPAEKTSVSWIEVGPHTSPCLAFLLERPSTVEVVMGALSMPLRGDGASVNHPSFTALCDYIIPASIDTCSFGLMSTRSMTGILLHRNGTVLTLSPTLSTEDGYFPSIKFPTSSTPSGLDSAGYVSLPDTREDSEGILHVFTVMQCQRELNTQTKRLDWTPPVLRHWLCCSEVGDTRDAQDPPSKAQSAPDFSHYDNITGGSNVKAICELCAGQDLVPRRIVRCKGSSLCAVLFYRDLGHKNGLSTNAVSYALIDTRRKEVLRVGDCRDFIFLARSQPGHEKALVLSVDGSFIQMLTRTPEAEDSTESTWNDGTPFCSVLGTTPDEEYVEGRRLLLLTLASRSRLLLLGTRIRDEQSCLVVGDSTDLDHCDTDSWTTVIPSIEKNSICWLQPKEAVLSLACLPSYEDSRHLISVATSSRVVLLSTALSIMGQVPVQLSSPSLASLGSHTVAFCSADFKLRYLCNLDGKNSTGLVATLPQPRFGRAEFNLIAMRPERFLYSQCHSGARLVEPNESADSFMLPTATTRPAFLLEPMVANALCEADNPGESTILLRSIIERFGRKVAPFPHGDDEGIGSSGTGLTPAVFELLSAYGLKHPASWLLTGSCNFDRVANSRILPPWMPAPSKAAAALNRDAFLHIIANGDQYFSDYVKSPDHNMASTLPCASDPSAVLCHEFARRAMHDGDVDGAVKLLDMAGTPSSDGALLNLALSLQLRSPRDVTKMFTAISGQGNDGSLRAAASYSSTTSSLAALATNLKSRQVNGKVPQDGGECDKTSDEFRRRWMAQLAPSIQRGHQAQRARHRLIGEDTIDRAVDMKTETQTDSRWAVPCNETKHVWNEGPSTDKENLLLLDRIEEWLGRRRPAVLGKEGAAAALERGEKTLADILNRAHDYDDASFGHEDEGSSDALNDGWVEGIGEGRTDEDNLSAYFRMSEGDDEDSTWRTDGLVDLTHFLNKGVLVGQNFSLQPTSSSVDEGEPGKVKLLYDLVFDESSDIKGTSGFILEASRGSSLDVGMLHGPANDARRRCSIEFWYHLPSSESVTGEIVLARRTASAPLDDLTRLCAASEKEGFLWELVLLPSGELEFRSSGGTSLLSTSESNSEFESNQQAMGDFGDDNEYSNDDRGLVSWERADGGGGWNHVCLVFLSRGHRSLTDCTVKMFMKGMKVASTIASVLPPGVEGEELGDVAVIDEAMKKTFYAFGLNVTGNYRMTELRLWSCERSEDDIKMMMYEYLPAAETKKKFKVKIRNKRGDAAKESRPSPGGLLSPPKEAGRGTKLLLPPPRQRANTGSSDKKFAFDASFRTFNSPSKEKSDDIGPFPPKLDELSPLNEPQTTISSVEPQELPGKEEMKRDLEGSYVRQEMDVSTGRGDSFDPNEIAPEAIADDLSTTIVHLSQQVRSSAAAALIRGPPATRHFGGNRGGLARPALVDRNTTKRFGVGAIAICGSEKTVVYAKDQSPPGKTYPIGASGAIISDEMDDDGSEYLCCFLAKDKRMVVFELQSKSVVVELQMTTKLNYWRYLPPQAHGHTLVFMLITPVGGFHWLPLDQSPRPRQVWKRGPDLQGKKIVTYEEGGSNGFDGVDALSAVALLLVSAASSGTPLEAWILQIGGESQVLCISSDVMGATLFRPYHIADEAFLPHLVTVTRVEAEIVVTVEPLEQNPSTGELSVAELSIGTIIDQSLVRRINFSPPGLAMGGWPEVICCSCEAIIVVCVRRKGLAAAYDCQEELVLIRQEHVGNYIVDAALRKGLGDADIELVLLLSDSENARDGVVQSIIITRPTE